MYREGRRVLSESGLKRRILVNLSVLVVSILACLCLGEAALRFVGSTDTDGNVFIRATRLHPHRIPLARMQALLAQYQASRRSTLVDDPLLGWSYRPGSASDDNLYTFDDLGIRTASREGVGRAQDRDSLAIVLFGDSFTMGAEVAFEESWGYGLEGYLQDEGINTSVLNCGVAGYGMDQAYLRWKRLAPDLQPDLVLFGFQPENVERNLNLIRCLYLHNTGIPFTKPRFLIDGERLKLVNSPTIPPEEIIDLLQNLESWELLPFEHYYKRAEFHPPIWQRVRVFSLLKVVADREFRSSADRRFFALDREPTRLALRILGAFQRDADALGIRFAVVHLPRKMHLEQIRNGDELPYDGLLHAIAREHEVIRSEGQFLEAAEGETFDHFFVKGEGGGHYSAPGHDCVARAVCRNLLASPLPAGKSGSAHLP